MVSKMKALLVLGAFAVTASGIAHAAVAPTAKCEVAKVKCVINKVKGNLGCQAKAAKAGTTIDSLCTQKVNDKFSGLPLNKSCMEKADAKNATVPCLTLADGTAIGAKVDAFVAGLQTTLYTNPAPTGANACYAGQTKCVSNYVKGILGCESKAVKTGLPVDPLCLSKVSGKFSAPLTGCMSKLDAAGKACTTSGQSGQGAATQVTSQAFIDDVRAEMMPNAVFTIVTQAGSGNCGTVSSVSGALLNLICGDLSIGGGAGTVPPGATPPGSTTRFSVLGTGATVVIAGAPASMVPASTRTCSRTGCKFGSPLPIANGPLSTCVTNDFLSNASGAAQPASGSFTGNIPLGSTTAVTANAAEPCPMCVGGFCDSAAANAGAPCTADSTTLQSHDCLPAGPSLPQFPVNLAGITTASSSATALSGLFCPGQVNAGAFGQPAATSIVANGSPATSLSSMAHALTLASVFCIPATGNVLIDGSADLPGPGATTLPLLGVVQ
ncbi:MAG TPA: hypothetical protein VMS22_11505 [Candidatus Eisenbacteria bacterium]|nr:hypothetical protein [Candidatus Eisenbacteria bacterium]